MALGLPPVPYPISLQGTMSGEDILSQQERLAQQYQQMLMQQAQAAAGQAQQAQQQYQQAAAQPVPQLNPAETFVPTLLSNIASVIARDPKFRERGQQGIEQKQSDLLRARQDNLLALRDVYSQKADEARRAQDLEGQEKYRGRMESLSRQLDQLRYKEKVAKDEDDATRQAGKDKLAQDKADREAARLELDTINKLTDNIRSDPELKDYAVIRDQWTTGKDARAAKNSAGDIILMRAIARATDPRTGVREEEYRTFQSAQGALARRGVLLTAGMVGQGQLTEAGRNALLARLTSIHNRKKVQSDRSLQRFRNQVKRANKLGVNITDEDVLQNYSADEETPSDTTQTNGNDPLGIR